MVEQPLERHNGQPAERGLASVLAVDGDEFRGPTKG